MAYANSRTTVETPLGPREIFRLDAVRNLGDVDSLPYCIKVLLEAALRAHDGHVVRDEDVIALARYDATKVEETEIAFRPGRVVLQDDTDSIARNAPAELDHDTDGH